MRITPPNKASGSCCVAQNNRGRMPSADVISKNSVLARYIKAISWRGWLTRGLLATIDNVENERDGRTP